MIAYGPWHGERLLRMQLIGLGFAFGWLFWLLLPGISAPPLYGSLLMLVAGVAWGIYSLRGKLAGDPTQVTAGIFLRAVPIAVAVNAIMLNNLALEMVGLGCAVASGALASGIGYAIWYTTLPLLKSTHAATVKLSVTVIAALGGIGLLGEPITLRLAVAAAILGGIALVIIDPRPSKLADKSR